MVGIGLQAEGYWCMVADNDWVNSSGTFMCDRIISEEKVNS